MLSCPYSLTVFGGVQGQVLGLARALRALGVDARIIAPCDGPPPEPGITTVGPSTRLPSNGSVAPIAQRPGRRPAHARGAPHVRARRAPPPRAAVARAEPRRAGRHHRARRRHVPLGARRPQRLVRDLPARRCRPMMRRLAVSHRGVGGGPAPGRRSDLRRRLRDPAQRGRRRQPRRRAGSTPVGRRRRSCSSAATSAARASRCCSTRSPGSSATPTSGSSATVPDQDVAARPRRAPSRVARAGVRGGEAGPAPRRDHRVLPGARRRVVRRGAARGDGRGHRARGVRHRRLPRRCPAPDREALLVPPGDADALRDALARAARRPGPAGRRSSPRAGARADEFSMTHLAERFLPALRAGDARRPARPVG